MRIADAALGHAALSHAALCLAVLGAAGPAQGTEAVTPDRARRPINGITA